MHADTLTLATPAGTTPSLTSAPVLQVLRCLHVANLGEILRILHCQYLCNRMSTFLRCLLKPVCTTFPCDDSTDKDCKHLLAMPPGITPSPTSVPTLSGVCCCWDTRGWCASVRPLPSQPQPFPRVSRVCGPRLFRPQATEVGMSSASLLGVGIRVQVDFIPQPAPHSRLFNC